MSIIKKAGKIFANLLTAILTPLSVLSQSAMKEINTANAVTIYK